MAINDRTRRASRRGEAHLRYGERYHSDKWNSQDDVPLSEFVGLPPLIWTARSDRPIQDCP